MIATSKQIALKCPVCAQDRLRAINLFEINNDEYCIECKHCDEQIFWIDKDNSNNYIVEILCYICGDIHSYTMSRKSFLESKLFALGCSNSGYDICYFGSIEEVSEAMEILNTNISKLIAEETKPNMGPTGPIHKKALKTINELAISGKIICLCGNIDLSAVINSNGIDVICKNCDAHEFITLISDNDLFSFCNRRSIMLTHHD